MFGGDIRMHIEQLKAFITVYDTRSFSSAAKQLIKSQSAITQLIHGLENELTAPLFLRHKRPIEPTAAGKAFYPYAVNILSTLQEGVAAAKATLQDDEGFTLSYLASSNNVMDYFLYEAKPETTLHLENITKSDYTNTSEWKENTLYFVRENVIQSKKILFHPVWKSKAYAIVSKDSSLAKKPVLTMQDLYGKTVLLPEKTRATTFAATLFKLFSSEPQIRIKALAETEARFSFIKIQHCISFCTAEYIQIHDAFSHIPFQDAGEFTYGFASLTEFTPPMKKLIRQFEYWLKSKDNKI